MSKKKILVGITGGIAAYKIPQLVRLLVKSGHEVQVVMTPAAHDFVSARTLSVLSGREVLTGFFQGNCWNNHVMLGAWADLFVVAPLTLNTLSKMSCGICDNFLLTVYYSARCPVMVFPAMDLEMYAHTTVKENIQKLLARGVMVFPADYGPLASGLVGEGRMPEPETIFRKIRTYFSSFGPWKGKKVLINAGPTYENMDPVRFIGNRSSGKMGVALADAFADEGASILLVLGPGCVRPENEHIAITDVYSACEMYDAMMKEFSDAFVTICTAAVSDFRPKVTFPNKIKKEFSEVVHLELIKNPDILKCLGKRKNPGAILVGFALETENELENGYRKLKEKNADYIIVNRAVQENRPVFGAEDNSVVILSAKGEHLEYPRMSKADLAKNIVKFLAEKHL